MPSRIAFITGASEGIGKACSYAFAEQGVNLILTARRITLLNEIADDIRSKFKVKVYAYKLDVTVREEVEVSVSHLPEEWKKIDILVNNAGLARGLEKLYEDDPDNWEVMIDTNIKGLLYLTRMVVPQMVERKEGHVINIGSIAGHEAYTKGGVYCATKFAVNAITKSLKMDTIDKNIRVSSIDPGAVETDFSNVRFFGDKERAKQVYKGIKPLVAEDIADAVIYCATRPPHVNIGEIILTPTNQASAFVIHREEK